MAIRQDRYVVADTNKIKKVDIIEVPQVPDDPVLRRSDVQQQVNNSTLPVSSRAVNLAIESVNSNLNLKADKTELEGLATEDYVNEKIDEKEVGITEPELISKSVGSGLWVRYSAVKSTMLKDRGSYYSPGSVVKELVAGDHGMGMSSGFAPNNPGLDFQNIEFVHYNVAQNYMGDNLVAFFNGYNSNSWYISTKRSTRDSWLKPAMFYSTDNAYPDSNGVLHNSHNPIDTLNTSDMADTVVDNDLLTVTSGAVFRAIKQLTDQIISLEARVRELEDGGV